MIAASDSVPDARLLALVADRTHSAVIIANARGEIEWVNAGFTRITGYALAEVLGRRPGTFLQGPDTDPATTAFMRARIRAGEGFRTEVLNYHKNGTPYWLDIEVQPVTGATGEITHFIAIEQDTTERKRTEQALKESEKRLKEAQAIARLGSWTWEPGTGRVWWSDALFRVFGLHPGAVVPSFEAFLGVLHPDDRPRALARVERLRAGADGFADDLRVVRPDGTTVWIHSRGQVTRGTAGELLRVEGTDQDITDRKTAEEELSRALAFQAAILESTTACVIAADRTGTVVTFNRAAEQELGWTAAEVIGRHTPALWHDPTEIAARAAALSAELGRKIAPGFEAFVARAALGHPDTNQWTLVRKDGTRFPVELTVTALRESTGGASGYLGVATNITQRMATEAKRREAEQQLQRAKDAAETAARTQSQFLANMSHELRTPVAAIVGYAEMLLDPRLGASERASALQTIMRSGRHLRALINDVLDLGKIEAGRMEVEHTSCRLPRLVLEAVAQADIAAREKKLDFRLVTLGKLPAALTTDPTRLRQILDNLLSNAVKFTEPGKRVELRLRLDPVRGEPRLVFEVHDEGIGIPPEALARLFQPFTQADASTTRRYGGTGLGLSISKRLANLLGGTITVQSTPGTGTCFTLSLPLTADDAMELVDAQEFSEVSQSTQLSSAPTKLNGRVLLAEDTPTIQTVIRYFLERAGLSVEVVDNGQSAVARALATEFDVILMDMQMPVMDGYAATSALRHSGYARAIVALTAHAMAADEEKCLRAGCNAYLSKPVDAARLIRVVSRQLASRSWVTKLDALERTLPAPNAPTAPPIKELSTLDKLTADYRSALPEKARALRQALAAGNVTRVSELAHRLRGSAGMYGLPEVSESAGRVEDACRAGQGTATIDELLLTFEASCANAGK